MTGEEHYRTLSRRKYVDIPEALELLQLYMRDYGLDGWKAQIYKHIPAIQAGRCFEEIKLIWLNEVTVSLVSPAKLRDMILHEIAHALTSNDSAHGKAWQDKALAIGVSHEHVMSTRVALEEALTGKVARKKKPKT